MTTLSFIIKSHLRRDEDSLIGGSAKNPYRLVKFLSRVLEVRHVIYFDGDHSGRERYRARRFRVGLLKLYFRTLTQNLLSAPAVWHCFRDSDFVQCHHPMYGLAEAIFRRLGVGRAKFIVKAHGTAMPELLANRYAGLKGFILRWNGIVHRWHDSFVLGSADLVLCSSEFQRAEMTQVYGIESTKLRCIYNGYDPEFLPDTRDAGPQQPLRVLFCGRVVPKKGIEHAIALFQRLAPHDAQARMILVLGRRREIEDGATYEKVRGLAAADPRILIEHDLTEGQLYQQMSHASFGLVTSRHYESIPTVVIEMLAAGLPVYATYSWGIPEIISPEFGLRGELEADLARILETDAAGRERAAAPVVRRIRERLGYPALIQEYINVYKLLSGQS